jgi:hypothetical protein
MKFHRPHRIASSFVLTAGAALALAAGCSTGAPTAPGEIVGTAEEHLDDAQCVYFDVNGKDTICHYTGSATHPYTLIKISDPGCINGHAGHAKDYITSLDKTSPLYDPTCGGGACLPTSAPCDATLPCCEGSLCIDGTCKDLCAGVTCTASDQCHVAGTCDPSTGACSNPIAPDGTGCNDGNACTQTDACQAGACVGGNPVTCTASDECHVAGTCDTSTGACSNPNAQNGIFCSTGICESGACYDPTLAFGAAQNTPAGSSAIAVAAGDVNGDGKQDLVVANELISGTVTVLLGNGDGTFASGGTVAAGVVPDAVTLADLNGDGKLDMVVGGDISIGPVVPGLKVFLGNGDGTFQSPTNYTTSNQPTQIVAVDLNGDGTLDLVSSDFVGSDLRVLLGNGDGTFQPSVSYASASARTPNSVAVGDFNGDGKPDLVSANFNSNNMSVWLGNGDGTFQPVVTYTTGAPGAISVAVGDLNRDGKLDVVVANENSSNVGALLGNGDGTFQTAVTYATGSFPAAVVLKDFDGDLRLDIAVINAGGNSASVLEGNGDGTFQTALTYAVGTLPLGLASADFNGDGKPDLATANVRSNNVSVLLNQSF